MTSVKDPAALLDRPRQELDTTHYGDVSTKSPVATSPTFGSGVLKADNLSTSQSTSGVVNDKPLTQARPSPTFTDGTCSVLEVVPLNPSRPPESSSTNSLSVTGSALDGYALDPIPPSQPARFLENHGYHHLTLSSSSILDNTESLVKNSDLSTTSPFMSSKPNISFDTNLASPSPKLNNLDSNDLHHKPLPITRLFARSAAPLHLPELDEKLERLPRFKFTHSGNDKLGAPRPFPPLNLLRGERLRDLVQNARPTPLWHDWSSIGSTVSLYCPARLKSLRLLAL